ncbi:hypothetical protein HNY73_022548 [Argiope bruennichi]|uniref:Uncharacterized protein n=1 Tax=Argiope bruennichi TaxID=94029 RepID=A0A8T0E179_ARGBR|nr:hypothetical protein HNY73_022548 [Argiope bruennichi]
MSGNESAKRLCVEETAMAIEHMQIAPTPSCERFHHLQEMIKICEIKLKEDYARCQALLGMEGNSPRTEMANLELQDTMKRKDQFMGEMLSIPACETPDVCSQNQTP